MRNDRAEETPADYPDERFPPLGRLLVALLLSSAGRETKNLTMRIAAAIRPDDNLEEGIQTALCVFAPGEKIKLVKESREPVYTSCRYDPESSEVCSSCFSGSFGHKYPGTACLH